MARVRLIRRLRDEFSAMPGLRLTEAQVQRLCSVDATTCASALKALVSAGFLRTLGNGSYVRSDLVTTPNEIATTSSRGGVPHPPWRRILAFVELEGGTGPSLSPASDSALRYATTLAVTARARVTALHIVPRSAGGQQSFLTEMMDRLAQSMSAESFRGLVDVHVAAGVPHEELLRTATEIGADLVVLGRRDDTRTEPLSRLREVLHETPCPVLIVHPSGHAAVA